MGEARAWLHGRRSLARELAPTNFALVSSVQVLAAFALWSPSGPVLWGPHGAALWLARGLFAAAWLFLVIALTHAGPGLQTGAIGWWSVVRGRSLRYPDFPTRGLFRVCRQPVYLAFAATLWTGPTRTADRLLLVSAWTLYCLVAPLHKEARYLASYGERFAHYRARVPYMIPATKP